MVMLSAAAALDPNANDLGELPNELFAEILAVMPTSAIGRLARTCKFFARRLMNGYGARLFIPRQWRDLASISRMNRPVKAIVKTFHERYVFETLGSASSSLFLHNTSTLILFSASYRKDGPSLLIQLISDKVDTPWVHIKTFRNLVQKLHNEERCLTLAHLTPEVRENKRLLEAARSEQNEVEKKWIVHKSVLEDLVHSKRHSTRIMEEAAKVGAYGDRLNELTAVERKLLVMEKALIQSYLEANPAPPPRKKPKKKI